MAKTTAINNKGRGKEKIDEDKVGIYLIKEYII